MGTRIAALALAAAAAIPIRANTYLPVLRDEIHRYWPELQQQSVLAAQIEQETCVTLKSKRCWSPRAELRTRRERGVGLGQITRTPKVDWLANLKGLVPAELANFTWRNPYDAKLQARAIVLKDSYDYGLVSFGENPRERLAFMLAAYNGGLPGLIVDRELCLATAGCNPSIWFGNVERQSLKSRLAVRGYGQSFFCVNRDYAWRIMFERRDRYLAYFSEESDAAPPPASPTQFGC